MIRSLVSLSQVLLLFTDAGALSSLASYRPRGSAAKPLDKQKVAVFGAGGYLGAYCFGFLQRASNLYGTGIGGSSSPRNICATSVGSQGMNSVLGKHFVLAYAGEEHIRLTDMTSVDAIAKRLEGYSAVVIGTRYTLEQRPVTFGSYGKGPNDKTLEFHMDKPKRGVLNPQAYSEEVHFGIFENTLKGCAAAGVRHAVVIETPETGDAAKYISAVQGSGVPFTYIRPNGDLTNCKDHTYFKGIQGDLSIKASESLGAKTSGISAPIYREDVAALVCQSLQSLSWENSRFLSVTSSGEWDEAIKAVKGRNDREWCGNSNVLVKKLSSIL